MRKGGAGKLSQGLRLLGGKIDASMSRLSSAAIGGLLHSNRQGPLKTRTRSPA